jgi:hypothetical protein
MPYKDETLRKAYAKAYREKHKEKYKLYQKEYRSTHDATAYKHEWYKQKRFDKYGITKQDFEALLIEQNHSCKICFSNFTELLRPQIDHCHDTEKVRGLLCMHCNTGIGQLRDSPSLLYRALCYLEKDLDD